MGRWKITEDLSPKKIAVRMLFTCLAAVVSAFALHVFVYPANFVPLGLEALVVILKQTVGVLDAGVWTLILNAPLIIWALFKLDKKYIIYSLLFTVVSSVLLSILEKYASNIVYSAETIPNGEYNTLLAAIFAGIMLGGRTGFMLRIDSSTGGADIIAVMIQRKMPTVNVERIISGVCLVLIVASYFVFKNFNCILLSVVQMFISERATTWIMRDNRQAIEIKIITRHPDEIREDLLAKMWHGATILPSKGLYSGQENNIILLVINIRQLSTFFNVIKKYPDTFVYYSQVEGIYGKFKRRRDDYIAPPGEAQPDTTKTVVGMFKRKKKNQDNDDNVKVIDKK